MINQIKVSVIIPVYNVEKYLEQCLDSVINQSFKDFEIILVNDGSTDNSLEICNKYKEIDSRIILINQENAGLAAARQSGLEIAKGEYITFVDSDDWLELNMYEKFINVINEYNPDIVFCNVFKNEDKKEKPYFETGFYNRLQMENIIFPRLLAGFDEYGNENTIRWCNWLRFYKKSLIDKNNIFFDKRFRRCQDLPFTFECTIHAQSYYYMGDDYLYHNRMNYESLSKGYTKNMWSLIKPLVLYLEDKVKNYKEYDFTNQLNKRAAVFVFDSCENENKPNNKKSLYERIKTINSIMKDKDARKWVLNMDISNMRKINKLYVFFFRFYLSYLLYITAEKRFIERKIEYKNK